MKAHMATYKLTDQTTTLLEQNKLPCKSSTFVTINLVFLSFFLTLSFNRIHTNLLIILL